MPAGYASQDYRVGQKVQSLLFERVQEISRPEAYVETVILRHIISNINDL